MTPRSNGEHDVHAQAHPSEVSERAAVWHDLVLAMHLLETALEKQAQRDGGVSHGHFKLLVLLAAAEDQTLGLKNLADSLRFSQSRISHALTALEGLGLVTRRPTVGGRRASEATLTDDGRHLVDRVLRGQRRELRDPLFSNLGDLGTVALGDLSARIITTLESDRPDGSRCGRTE